MKNEKQTNKSNLCIVEPCDAVRAVFNHHVCCYGGVGGVKHDSGRT